MLISTPKRRREIVLAATNVLDVGILYTPNTQARDINSVTCIAR
jgi:hypothetical protein